jgi:hypothetical protein
MAEKNLTTMQDFHTSLGDNIKKRAADMQNMIESTPFKYDVGHHVFTEDSAKKNFPPMRILSRVMVGNDPMRVGGIGSKVVKDPVTGKTMRTPHEPGYRVRLEHSPENWSEFRIPETAIKGRVDLANGGVAHMGDGGAIHLKKLGKFFKQDDPLQVYVPERKNMTYALHPDKWESTFYSLTNKDPKKLKHYSPKKLDIPPGTLVGDMAHANKFYRAKTDEEKAKHAKAYRDSLKPYPVNISEYKFPELLIPKSTITNFKGGGITHAHHLEIEERPL